MNTGSNRILFGGEAEGIEPHGMEDVEAPHSLVATQNVGGGVTLGMPHVQASARWVREHVEAIKLRLRRVKILITGIRCSIGIGLIPDVLPTLFDLDRHPRVVAASMGFFLTVGGGPVGVRGRGHRYCSGNARSGRNR